MKKVILLVAIFFVGFSTQAQVSQEGYFSLKDNLVVWAKIYDTIPDLESMKKNPLLEFTSESSGLIKKSKPIPLTKRELNEITGSFRIEEKNGRYRVEVLNIRSMKSSVVSVNTGMFEMTDPSLDFPIEDFAINKKIEISSLFWDHVAKPYDNLFSGFFDPKAKKDDW